MKQANISELMIELISDKHIDTNKGTATERGLEIINELSGYAYNINLRIDKHLYEYLKSLTVRQLWLYLFFEISVASTTFHRDLSVVTVMPFIKAKIYEQ